MSRFTTTFNQTFHLNRYSDILYKGEVIETSIQIDPMESARIEIELDTAQTGSIYLVGSTTECLSFADIFGVQSTNYFTALNGLTPSGLTGIMTVKAKTGDGSPVSRLAFETSFFGDMKQVDGTVSLEKEGMVLKDQWFMLCDSDVDITIGDIVYNELDPLQKSYEVTKCVSVQIDGMDDHKKIVLR